MQPLKLQEQYQDGSSAVHRLDPRVKLLGALGLIVAASSLPFGAWLPYLLLFLATLFVAQQSRLGLFFAARRSFVALPFALAAVTLPFTIPGTSLAQLGPLSVSLEGSVRFASIVVKSWVSVQIAILMAATTPFSNLLWALHALRVPRVLVGIIGFMYRYLFVLSDEAARMMRARDARSAGGVGKSGRSLFWRGKVAGGMIGTLMIRAFERSERIYAAMVSRGYDGDMRMLTPPTMTARDRFAAVGWVTYLTMVLLIGFVF